MFRALIFVLAMSVQPAFAEGPATGPSSQGGDESDTAPHGVEKSLNPQRVKPDPSEDKPSTNTATPEKLDEPKVKAEPDK